MMEPLSVFDQMFLHIEKRQQPAHVGCLMIFKQPQEGALNIENTLLSRLREYNKPVSPYNLKLKKKGFRYFWKHDCEFDIQHHIRHIALPKPGRIRELFTYLSAEHSNLMHRERPLWECHIIEGIQGNRFAIYFKMHHAMSDGISALHYLTRFLSNNPHQNNMPPPWAIGSDPLLLDKKRVPNSRENKNTLQASLQIIKTVPSVYQKLMDQQQIDQNALQSTISKTMFALKAPQTIINTRISGSRRYAAQSYDLKPFKDIARHFECTLNDVVLTLCGGALRLYLQSQNALPKEPLIAFVPVSIRKDDSKGGNQIAMVQASLGTHIEDPARRLEGVVASINVAKRRLQKLTKEEFLIYSAITLTPGVIHLATGLLPERLPCNVVISNVPGPKDPLYWNGAKLQGLYPMSQPIDRVALNLTMVSYDGSLEFGITACRRSIPSMQSLLGHIEQSVNGLTDYITLNVHN
ncbi:MAG: wax ester/triacylglycerol synthase family O-acyltransferase [Pseudomonadales bacterium]|nr:wax ester/triacylglycerol synthase family O-acyltransferase [Pseudomonadales bacterium]